MTKNSGAFGPSESVTASKRNATTVDTATSDFANGSSSALKVILVAVFSVQKQTYNDLKAKQCSCQSCLHR